MIEHIRLSWTRLAAVAVLALVVTAVGISAWGNMSFARRLRAAGYTGASGETQVGFLIRRVKEGGEFSRVSTMLPTGAESSYHLLTVGADSVLVQRFAYGLGEGVVDVYYHRSGKVADTYVDSHPSLHNSRKVLESAARSWFRVPSAGPAAEPTAAADEAPKR